MPFHFYIFLQIIQEGCPQKCWSKETSVGSKLFSEKIVYDFQNILEVIYKCWQTEKKTDDLSMCSIQSKTTLTSIQTKLLY